MKCFTFILIIALLFTSCESEEIAPNKSNTPTFPSFKYPDTLKPVIEVTEPEPNTSFAVIDRVQIKYKVTDKGGMESIQFYLTDISRDEKRLVSEINFADRENKNSISVNSFLSRRDRPLSKDVSSVSYKAILVAKDTAGNIGKDSIIFIMHAPDYNKQNFVEATTKSIHLFDSYDWLGYEVPKDPEAALAFVLFLMLDNDYNSNVSESEWIRFVQDFNLSDQFWATWDEDKNGNLNLSEFTSGILPLKFYKDWDTNKDASISEAELAGGLFDRWDNDKDKMLSRDEYEERFFTYYLNE